MRKTLFFVYGVTCHLLFLAIYAYLTGFLGNFLVPKSIDSPPGGPILLAFAVDLLLIVLFGAQHSIMARPAFKRVWTRIVPAPIERSTYVLVSCLVTMLLFWQWRTLDGVIWDVQSPIGRGILWGLFAAGCLMVPAVSLIIDHFDLFGTRQVWLYLRGREYTPLPFQARMVYKYIRHPLYVGWALLFWATPTMSLGHLLFAGSLTAYMALAARIEERDLVKHFGRRYEEYRRRVGMFLPRLGRGRLAGREAAPAGLLQAAEAVPARREAGVRCLVQGPAALVSNVRGVTRLPRTNHGTEKVAAGDAATR